MVLLRFNDSIRQSGSKVEMKDDLEKVQVHVQKRNLIRAEYAKEK